MIVSPVSVKIIPIRDMEFIVPGTKGPIMASPDTTRLKVPVVPIFNIVEVLSKVTLFAVPRLRTTEPSGLEERKVPEAEAIFSYIFEVIRKSE